MVSWMMRNRTQQQRNWARCSMKALAKVASNGSFSTDLNAAPIHMVASADSIHGAICLSGKIINQKFDLNP